MVELHSPLIEAVLASNGTSGLQGDSAGINCPAVVVPAMHSLDADAGVAGAAVAVAVALASTNADVDADADATLVAAHTKVLGPANNGSGSTAEQENDTRPPQPRSQPEQLRSTSEEMRAAMNKSDEPTLSPMHAAMNKSDEPALSPQRLKAQRSEHKYISNDEERPEVNADAKADDATPPLPMFPGLEGVATVSAYVPPSQSKDKPRRERAVMHESYEGDGDNNGDGGTDFGSSPTSVLLFDGNTPLNVSSELDLQPMDHRRAKRLVSSLRGGEAGVSHARAQHPHDIKSSNELHMIVEKRNRRNSMAF